MQRKLTHLSLCSGIGGLDLAAEWAGFKTVAQCEIDDYASKVLAKNFKGVPNLNDIRTVTNERLREYGVDPAGITVISAGFPCQPYSLAGKGLGDSDSRDLWGEVARVLGEVKPRWFVGENTPGLFARENQRYFRRVLDDLTALGYSVGWGIWGACDIGAPHKRDRVFIVAHANGERRTVLRTEGEVPNKGVGNTCNKTPFGTSSLYGEVSNSDGKWKWQSQRFKFEIGRRLRNISEKISNTRCGRYELQEKQISTGWHGFIDGSWWETEPDVGRVANGIPARVDRLRCNGNAVVPYQALPIFEAIAEIENYAPDLLALGNV